MLGINSSATDEEVKKAYRRMAMKYHPDKVEGLGEEVKRNAEAQFREINEAYESIKQARGMKWHDDVAEMRLWFDSDIILM